MRNAGTIVVVALAGAIGLTGWVTGVRATQDSVLLAQMGPMDQGLMDRGMMGHPMTGHRMMGEVMGGGPAAHALRAYIRRQHLACLSCHRIYRGAVGPAFAAISARYRGRPGASRQLAEAIAVGVSGAWAGFRAMPGGLATPLQARRLATLILHLQSAHHP